jgi:serine/threonine-protein kinase HipA
MRRAEVYFKDLLAGFLTDFDDHYEFQYTIDYLNKGFPISVTLPLQKEAFISKQLFPFFDGLIVEGWLLNVAKDNWKINPNDRMGLLLLLGEDTIGAVSIKEVK